MKSPTFYARSTMVYKWEFECLEMWKEKPNGILMSKTTDVNKET
jgi:hypothetical protein